MATDTQHLEGIRLQAERVVRAYHQLVAKAKEDPEGDWVEGLGALFVQVRQLDGWLQPAEGDADSSDDETSGAEPFSEYAERELENVRNVMAEIDHLAHDGQESTDPTMTLAVIERIAGDTVSILGGHFWDNLTAGLKRADDAEGSDTLRRAAKKVIKLYRAGENWDSLAGESEGGYVPLPELEEALGDLDKALEGGAA